MVRKKLDRTKKDLIQEIKKLKRRRKRTVIEKTDKRSLRINIVLLTFTFILLIFTFGIFLLGFWQFSIIKEYQNWSRYEMSRRAKLSLQVDDIELIETDHILEVHCALLNTGNANARDVQIRFKLIECKSNDKSEACLDVEGPNITRFEDNGTKIVKLAVWKHQEVIYFREDTNNIYRLKLPWIWTIKHVPAQAEKIFFRYNIDSNYGSTIDSLELDNPFFGRQYKKDQ